MTEPYDIVVIGGGITGAGIVRDAALRGLRVALFEKGDYGSGTSSKSSKLVHGGLRYLEQGEIGLVFESVSERRIQSRVAPHLVRPLRFLVPIYDDARVGVELMNVGLWIYDTLAMFRSPALHKTYRGDKARALEPSLAADRLTGAIEYSDCMTDDARLVLENILDARRHGADCRTYAEVLAVERRRGQVAAVRVRDVLTGVESRHATHAVIIAAGPWTDQVAGRLELGYARPLLRPTKGVHLVFHRDKLPISRVLTLMSPIDGRVMFAIPWRHRIVIGTTDTDFTGSPDQVHADPADAEYLCRSANLCFPDHHFSPAEAIASWAGLRPLIHEDADTASDVSREHQLYVRDDGVLIIAGGKLTTYRLMAREAVTAALRWLGDHHSDLFEGRTLARAPAKTRPLPGGEGLPRPDLAGVQAFAAELAQTGGLAPALATHLSDVYGGGARRVAELIAGDPALAEPMQDDLPYVWAEVVHATTHELARTIDDVLTRRVPLCLVGLDQGLDVCARVGELMAARLGWDARERERQLASYHTVVTDSRRFR